MRIFLAGAITFVFSATALSWAGVAPNGAEFQVNTYTTSYQTSSAVAMSGTGEFVVVWVSNLQDGSSGGIFGQRFDSSGSAVGAEFQVNTYTTDSQTLPVVATDPDGDFVVVWRSAGQDGSGVGVFGQMFDSGGGFVGAEFQVNTYTTSEQRYPAVAMDTDGDFVVVWSSEGQDGSSKGVFGQMFDSGGGFVGAEFQVNTYTTSYQYFPAVAMSGAGDFVVVWQSGSQDGDNRGIFAQMFDSGGGFVGAEFQVNTYTSSAQSYPSVAMDADGDFVVGWYSHLQDGSQTGAFGQMFDSGGGFVGAEFQVNTYTTGGQSGPRVAMNGTGDFVATWFSYGQDGSESGVFGQLFDSAGIPVAAEFQVNTYTMYGQAHSRVAMGETGEIVVAWSSSGQDGDHLGIFAQRALANGPALTSPLPAGTVDCSSPALSRPTFTWDLGDYDRFKVFMGSSRGFEKGTRVTSGDRKILTGSWTPGKKKWKRACDKAINQAADPNQPVMYVAVKGIDRDLRKKDPLRKLFSFVVRANVQP